MLRHPWFWIPLYIFIIGFVFHNFKSKSAFVFLIFCFFAVGVADVVNSQILKDHFKRLRPCHTEYLETAELVPCSHGYSFPSSHAANHFALSFFMLLSLGALLPKIKMPLIVWAAMISLAQVYVGIHYPFDVIAGGVVGVTIGFVLSLVYRWMSQEYYPLKF